MTTLTRYWVQSSLLTFDRSLMPDEYKGGKPIEVILAADHDRIVQGLQGQSQAEIGTLRDEMDRIVAVGQKIDKDYAAMRTLLDEREVQYRRTQDINLELKAKLAAMTVNADEKGEE